MELSERLKTLRLEAGYTQKELASKLDKSYQIYQTWENGKRNPKKDSLEKLASVFNVSVSYLLGETDEKSPSKIVDLEEIISIDDVDWDQWLSFGGEPLTEHDKKKIIEIFGNRLKK